MFFKFNRYFYRTVAFWLGILCGIVELGLWSADGVALRALGLGTSDFLILIGLGWDTK